MSARFDLLRAPVVGAFLRWRWARTALQLCLLLVSAVMLAHAFFGPDLAPKNLATLLTWVHFRGLVVLALLLAGNFFCMACPFMLPRALARRLVSPAWRWPRALRTKWPGILLFTGVLYAYELFDLWGDPYWTGVLIAGYFASALAVDVLFREAAFCRYVCPVGQFNFVGSAMSPLEIAVVDADACTRCTTRDCIRGNGGQRGCELGLYLPRKVDNLDCTFCLDCVQACPHDNIGLLGRVPAEALAFEGTRSGIGDLARRSDWTALIVVFAFGALLNALAMVSPVYAFERAVARAANLTAEWPVLALLFALVLLVAPALLLGGAAALTRRLTGVRAELGSVVQRFARCLVPFGFGVWLAHYGFHFFTGVLTVIPVTQLALGAAEPQWQLGGLPERYVFPIELGFLGLGLLGSLMVAGRIAAGFCPTAPGKAFAPWSGVLVALTAAALWILSQPMDMRGTFLGG